MHRTDNEDTLIDSPPAPPTVLPPPPPPAGTPPGAGPPGVGPASGRRRWPVLLGILAAVLLIGGGLGYLVWHAQSGKPSAARATGSPSASASATASASVEPSETPTPSTAVTTGQGVVPCPVTAPAGQHPLGSPAGPGEAQHADPSLDFCGRGNATLPPGTARFTTADNWGLGVANSCPSGSAGPDGMGPVLTITELLPGGSAGIDTDTQQGDWTDDGGANMSTGGNYQLRVQAASPNCVWHIAVYPS